MKESLKNFYEYTSSEEELKHYIRKNVEWNEDSFCRMKKLIKAVRVDYADEETCPKNFARYLLSDIPSIIDMLSEMKGCTEDKLPQGYTRETYASMLTDRIEQLNNLI